MDLGKVRSTEVDTVTERMMQIMAQEADTEEDTKKITMRKTSTRSRWKEGKERDRFA